MSEDIKSRLQEYVKQEQVLLDQILQLGNQKNVGAEIGKAVLSEGAAALAAGLFESSTAGRLGRKLTKSALDQQQKNQLMIQERNIESQHNSLVQRVSDFVSSVSIKRRSLQEANSYELIRKLERAQEFLKVETRIRRTVTILMSIASKQLIYNKDIQASQSVKEIIILPGEPFSGSLRLKEMLRSVRGYAKIIDPYVDETTLEILFEIPEDVSIKLLTEHTGGEGKEKQFGRACQKFITERPLYQARKCEPRLIHDRFILTKTQGWSVGSSLKDIGKKMSMIKEISIESKTEAERKFEELWRNAKDLLA
jgi:hypothetical protein